MKFIFSIFALATFLVAPLAQASTVEHLLAELHAAKADLAVLQLNLDAAKQSMSPAGEVAGIQFETNEEMIALKTVTITIEGGTTLQNEVASEAEARRLCESVAFNTNHMWKLVTCEFDGTTIYSDVFIAG